MANIIKNFTNIFSRDKNKPKSIVESLSEIDDKNEVREPVKIKHISDSPIERIKPVRDLLHENINSSFGRILNPNSYISALNKAAPNKTFSEKNHMDYIRFNFEFDIDFLFNNRIDPCMGGIFGREFFISVGLDVIEQTKIKSVIVSIEICRNNGLYKFSLDSCLAVDRKFHIGEADLFWTCETFDISKILSTDLTSRDSNYNQRPLVIDYRCHQESYNINEINNFIHKIREGIKNSVIDDFKNEVLKLRKIFSDNKSRIEFEETITDGVIKECFIELFDDGSSELSRNSRPYKYVIKIPVESSKNVINLNDKYTEMFFNITEGSNRIRGLYDCCEVGIDFLNNDSIIISIGEKIKESVESNVRDQMNRNQSFAAGYDNAVWRL
jgi:hypothetical protein